MKTVFNLILFLISTCSFAQDISVYSYDLPKIQIECVENWIEDSLMKYNGVYIFKHFGTEAYILEGVEDNKSFKLKVETMVYSDSTVFTIIAFSGNELTAKYESGEEFKARFVVLKCDVNDYIIKNVKGLLIDEELIFIIESY